MCREALDDFVRFLRDKEVNSQVFKKVTKKGIFLSIYVFTWPRTWPLLFFTIYSWDFECSECTIFYKTDQRIL